MNVQRDRRITIMRPTISKSAVDGSAVKTYTVFATVWAERRDALPSRSEDLKQGMERARDLVRYRFFYLAGLDSSMRVHDAGQVLQIVGGPAEIGRRQYHEISCEQSSIP